MEDEELAQTLEDAAAEDIDRIDPVPEYLTLTNGTEVKVVPLRTRQLFKLLRIITHGSQQAIAGLSLGDLDFNKDNPAEFTRKLAGLVLFSIPDAEQEAIEFIGSMVEPADLVDKGPRDLNEKERNANIEAWTTLNMELWNPDPSDTIDILENVVRREASDIQSLGKRLRGFLEVAEKTGQLKAKSNGGGRSRESVELPEPSPARSTSSRASTAGKTRSSSTSRSGASARSPRPSPSAAGKKSAQGAP